MDMAGRSEAGRLVVNGGGDGQHFNLLLVDESPRLLHVAEGGFGDGVGVAAKASGGIFVHIIVDLPGILGEHDQPFLVEYPDMIHSALLADIVDDIAAAIPGESGLTCDFRVFN
jgi:hypothetical protein